MEYWPITFAIALWALLMGYLLRWKGEKKTDYAREAYIAFFKEKETWQRISLSAHIDINNIRKGREWEELSDEELCKIFALWAFERGFKRRVGGGEP